MLKVALELQGIKMKITKKQLKKIIRESARKSFSPMKSRAHKDIRKAVQAQRGHRIREGWGESIETGSDLIDFAKAYSSLGSSVQEQFEALANAWIIEGAHEPAWSEAVYEQNPNAIDVVEQRLSSILKRLDREGIAGAGDLLDVIEEAQKIYRQGDAEVDADRTAAEEGY